MTVDIERAARATRDLLVALGEDPERSGLVDTPMRVARAWAELLDSDPGNVNRIFPVDQSYDEMVTLGGITGWSMCEHHLLPFSYVATVAYIPNANAGILGLSKLARIVRHHGGALQLQERMANQTADEIMAVSGSSDVAVSIRGVHTCASMRGVKAEGAQFTTTSLHGRFRTEPTARAEFMQLLP